MKEKTFRPSSSSKNMEESHAAMPDSLQSVLQEIKALGDEALSGGLFTAGSYAVGHLNEVSKESSGSWPHSPTNTVFDLSSLTKALVTTPLVLREALVKGVTENEPLKEIFPDHAFIGLEDARNLKLSDVLRHTAGLPFWKNLYAACGETKPRPKLEVLREALMCLRDDSKNVYSDVGMILLGHLISETRSKSLSDVFENFLREELCLNPKEAVGPGWNFSKEDCATTGWCAVRNRELKGEVHDENAWALGGFPGHSGLFGSVRQVAEYLKALNSSRVGKQVLAKNAQWAENYPDSDSALGWRTGRDTSSRSFGGGHSIGHLGFTGTAFWVDPVKQTFAVLLTNRVAKSRTQNMKDIKVFREKMFRLMQAWVDQDLRGG